MRGQDHIIQMRIAGRTPKIVFLNDWPCKTDWFEHSDHATVSTAGDALSSLDLRFLVGLTVSISSESETRAKALFAKSKWFGAKTVAAVHCIPSVLPHKQSGWTEVFRETEKEVACA